MTTPTLLLLDTTRRGELHHAIILYGPSPSLLRDVSVRLAKTLNCPNGSTSDDCLSCHRIDRRTHPDVHFIEAAADRSSSRSNRSARSCPRRRCGRTKGATRSSSSTPRMGSACRAPNSLLKTLEEPARDTHFILLTRSPDLLLPTIKSRSQQMYVGDTQRALTGPREALRIRQVALMDEGDDLAGMILDLLHRYATRGESAALLALAAIVSDHDDAKDAIALLGAILCDVVALDPAESLDPKKLAEIREGIPREKLLAAADASMAAIRWFAVNADVRLLAESVVAALV
jgi:hypothetical protein